MHGTPQNKQAARVWPIHGEKEPMRGHLALAANVALRAAIVIFLSDAVLSADDSRFAGKGIGTRGLIILPLSLLLPVLYLTRRRGQRYPFWMENYSDVIFGLHNVRGTWDVVNDLMVGVLGSAAYGAVFISLVRRSRGG
jgi:hypothetical protein